MHPDEFQSAPYDTKNVLDLLSSNEAMNFCYDYCHRKESEIYDALVKRTIPSGKIISIGCGPNCRSDRYHFPSDKYYLVGVDSGKQIIEALIKSGNANEGHVFPSHAISFGDGSFDIVYFRAMLHHLVVQGTLQQTLAEARRLLRPGGILIAFEPNVFYPVGAMMNAFHYLKLDKLMHGTDDDIALSPYRLKSLLQSDFDPVEIRGVTFTWRRMPVWMQQMVRLLDKALISTRLGEMFTWQFALVAVKK